MYGVVTTESAPDATAIAQQLEGQGVETRPFFLGLHEQPVLRERGLGAERGFPVAERIARRGLYLPSGVGLRDDEIEQVVDALANVLS
jgi:perosamine synthetase